MQQRGKLSAKFCESVSKPGRHGDGLGLWLVVDKSGARRWSFIWRRGKAFREMGLGSPSRGVNLKLAREFAASAREALARGLDPIHERERTRAVKQAGREFGELAIEFIEGQKAAWKNSERHSRAWQSSLEVHAATIWTRRISEVTTDEVVTILSPLWRDKPDIGRRVQNRLERIFDAAKVRGLRDGENPARWKGHLSALLPRRARADTHFAAMPYKEVPAFVAALRGRQERTASALELLILTAARTSEILNATWSEFDLKTRVWTIPPVRMKAGREHRVPLTSQTLQILEAQRPEFASATSYVFPGGKTDKPLSNMALSALLKRMGIRDATPHGFRSSFRDWGGDSSPFPRELLEAALSHTIGDAAELAYRRGDALERRRALMAAWATFVDGPVAPIEDTAVDKSSQQ